MWSHYAANHTGICLEFDIHNLLFSEAMEVTYRVKYPRWAPPDMEQIAFNMFLTKSDAWKDEQEFRIIGAVDSDKEHLIVEGDCLRLPPGALQSVIVGCQADHEAVRKIVGEHAPGLAVKRAGRVPNHYSLTIKDAPSSASAE
jgi:hypothetical protein